MESMDRAAVAEALADARERAAERDYVARYDDLFSSRGERVLKQAKKQARVLAFAGTIGLSAGFPGAALTAGLMLPWSSLTIFLEAIDHSPVDRLLPSINREEIKYIKERFALISKEKNVLHLAAESGSLELVKAFEPEIEDIDSATTDGHSALGLSVRNGHSEIIKYLLSKGANVRKGEWHIAEMEGKNEILKLVMQLQIDGLRQQEDSECSICMINDSNDPSARFSICDYQCLTPICKPCKATLQNSKCPFCRADLCQDLDA